MLRPLAFGSLLLFALPGLSLQEREAVPTAERLTAGAEAVIAQAAEANHVHDHLVELTETFGPRLAGSRNLTAAGEWARDRFASWGLEASMERWGEFPVGFERGVSLGTMIAPESRPLTFVTMAWTPGTDGPTRGRAVLEPTELEDFDASLYEGAWIVRRIKDRPKAALRKGLDAALDEAGMLGEVRNGGRNPVIDGRWKIDPAELPTRISPRLIQDDYNAIVDALEAGTEVVLEFHIENEFVEGPIDLFNVIADIPGTEFPDEYVIVGGHLDSWDGAVGAQDNGTGVSTTMEAARLIMASGIKPRRTIRFMLWSGEEQGLLGSVAYATANPEVCERTSAVLVHDGGGNYLSSISGPEALVEDLRAVFEPVLELNPAMPFQVNQNRGLSTMGMSDHAAFVQKGVPGFFWGQSGELEYSYVHHTLHDNVAEVNRAYQEHSAIIVGVGALGLANLDTKLDRTDLVRPSRFSNRRTMGVYLDEATVSDVIEGGKAAAHGWKAGDVIVSIDGVAVATREEIVAELHKGETKKVITILRGEKRLEFTLDWAKK
ncbi:MAG: M20/M25/M40 family metallo-hydrolase [Planctomycetota bacterium]|nr:M20/M25/M40 family metallo-hydrolase [Planctomycetota bacterium]